MKLRKEKSPKPPASRRTGFTLRDLVHEALEGVGSRPSRLFIMLLGTVLGIASLVATVGLAQTAAGQISKTFDKVSASRVVIEPGKTDGGADRQQVTVPIPWNAVELVSELAGVEESALYSEVSPEPSVLAVQVTDPSQAPTAPPTVVATSAGLLDVVDAHIQTGRFFDAGHAQRADRVAVLGANAAEKLGVNRITGTPAIYIGDRPYSVIGIIDQTSARESLLDSVIVPVETAREDLGLSGVDSLDIRIAVGAGPVVSRQAPIALSPNSSDGYKVRAPSTASDLEGQVQADVNVLFISIGLVALLAGGVGITNVNLLSVSERRGEIGLRRALGAKTNQIAGQFMLESLTTGILGGLIGVSFGLFILLGVSIARHWTPVISPWVAPVGVIIGALVGLIAGTYPAIKAARVEPVDALRDS